jgi:hypothetical protein
VTDDGVALSIAQAEEISSRFLFALFLFGALRNGCDNLLVLPIRAGADALEEIAHWSWKAESTRIPSFELLEKRSHGTAIDWEDGSTMDTARVAIPLGVAVDRSIDGRRVDAVEVECTCAPVAADQLPIAAARCAVIVVLIGLRAKSAIMIPPSSLSFTGACVVRHISAKKAKASRSTRR